MSAALKDRLTKLEARVAALEAAKETLVFVKPKPAKKVTKKRTKKASG